MTDSRRPHLDEELALSRRAELVLDDLHPAGSDDLRDAGLHVLAPGSCAISRLGAAQTRSISVRASASAAAGWRSPSCSAQRMPSHPRARGCWSPATGRPPPLPGRVL